MTVAVFAAVLGEGGEDPGEAALTAHLQERGGAEDLDRPWKAPATSVRARLLLARGGEVGVPGHEQLDAHEQLADRHVLREEVVGADLQAR